MAALLIFSFCLTLQASQAQLPPTNMSKHVRTPGDNQYTGEGRQFRHAPPRPAPVRQAAPGPAAMPGWRKTPPPRRPDITLEPIAADEPIALAGFPPLPDRVELPIAMGGGSKWLSSGGRGGGGGGRAMSPAAGGRNIQTSMHQHYKHITPGAYAPAKNTGQAQTGGGSGYYKARTPSKNTDFYSSGGPPMPKYMGASPGALKRLGREPKLEDRNQQPAQPEAPTPVVVSQTKTQDLSLPEDEFEYASGQNKNRALKKFKRQVRRTVRRGVRRARSMAPGGF